MMPFFSIIIATYNRKVLTAETVDRILSQTLPDFEVILVDDGSTDGSYEYLYLRYATDSRVRTIYQENTERGSARNNGIKNANGLYLVFVDSDDYVDRDHLKTLHDFILLESYPNFLTCKFNFIENGRVTRAPIDRLEQGYYDYKLLLEGNTLGMYSCARRENKNLILFEANREYAIFEDWMFHFVNLRHDKIFIIDRTTYHINNHNERSMRSSHIIINKKIKIAVDWIISRVELSTTEIKQLRAFMHYFAAIHAYADHTLDEAKKELKAAYNIKGTSLPYFILWVKCIVGKKILSTLKAVFGKL
jgi:glycosyltransferase involved in cell wall biosynthesis